MSTPTLLQRVNDEVKTAGLRFVRPAEEVARDSAGNEAVVGELGPILVRFVRDRGQDWLELGPSNAEPRRFYSFQDVQVALGWKSCEEVLAMKEVEPLGQILQRITSGWLEITKVFSGEAGALGWKRVEKVARERGEAFAARLRSSVLKSSDT